MNEEFATNRKESYYHVSLVLGDSALFANVVYSTMLLSHVI